MAYSAVPTVTTGDLWTAANHNTYIKDNFAAGVPDLFFEKGDIAAASGENTGVRLAVGANNTVLMAASGETSGLKYAFVRPQIGLVSISGAFTCTNTDWEDITGATLNLTLEVASTVIMWASGTLTPNEQATYFRGNIDGTGGGDTTIVYGNDAGDITYPFALTWLRASMATGSRTVKLQCKRSNYNSTIQTATIVAMAFPTG